MSRGEIVAELLRRARELSAAAGKAAQRAKGTGYSGENGQDAETQALVKKLADEKASALRIDQAIQGNDDENSGVQ